MVHVHAALHEPNLACLTLGDDEDVAHLQLITAYFRQSVK